MDLNETRERIIYQKEGAIAKITLNWPEKANAQDQKLAEEVDAALLDADRDYDIKVLVLKANGKGFCSGHAIGNNAIDYPAFVENAMVTGHPWKAQSDLFVKPTLNLWEFSKPTIAQVHGYCVGGGTHMGLTTDIVIASEDAYFSYPPLQGFGMPSGECSIEPWVFMNWRRAAYYLFTAEVIDAQEGAGGRPGQRGGQARGPRRAGRRDRPPHRPGSVDDADAHQGQSQAGMGADGHAGALAELQRPRRARVDQQGCAGADPAGVQGQGAAVRNGQAPGRPRPTTARGHLGRRGEHRRPRGR